MSSPTRPAAGADKVKKQSGRLNLAFCDFDSNEKLQERFKVAQNRRKIALMLLAEERIIKGELVHIYKDIAMPSNIKIRISSRVQTAIDLSTYLNPEYL